MTDKQTSAKLEIMLGYIRRLLNPSAAADVSHLLAAGWRGKRERTMPLTITPEIPDLALRLYLRCAVPYKDRLRTKMANWLDDDATNEKIAEILAEAQLSPVEMVKAMTECSEIVGQARRLHIRVLELEDTISAASMARLRNILADQ